MGRGIRRRAGRRLWAALGAVALTTLSWPTAWETPAEAALPTGFAEHVTHSGLHFPSLPLLAIEFPSSLGELLSCAAHHRPRQFSWVRVCVGATG